MLKGVPQNLVLTLMVKMKARGDGEHVIGNDVGASGIALHYSANQRFRLAEPVPQDLVNQYQVLGIAQGRGIGLFGESGHRHPSIIASVGNRVVDDATTSRPMRQGLSVSPPRRFVVLQEDAKEVFACLATHDRVVYPRGTVDQV